MLPSLVILKVSLSPGQFPAPKTCFLIFSLSILRLAHRIAFALSNVKTKRVSSVRILKIVTNLLHLVVTNKNSVIQALSKNPFWSTIVPPSGGPHYLHAYSIHPRLPSFPASWCFVLSLCLLSVSSHLLPLSLPLSASPPPVSSGTRPSASSAPTWQLTRGSAS